jgi:hypothetical protein
VGFLGFDLDQDFVEDLMVFPFRFIVKGEMVDFLWDSLIWMGCTSPAMPNTVFMCVFDMIYLVGYFLVSFACHVYT